MDGEILDAVTEWGTRSVSDGVSGLYELADESFSGAVTDGTAWAFVLNGRFVGVFDGAIEDFEDASLTAHTASDLSLPLLYAMQARGGDVRGQYYSNDTPLSEIDETLSSGNFVGYVELSENVLSGDYYVVYYGGRSLPVAFVGNTERLLTGDEAFERAADEVGIYSVVDADIEVVELPGRPEPEPESDDTAVAIAADTDADAGDSSSSATEEDDSSEAAGAEGEPSGNVDDGATAAESEFGALDMTGDEDEGADAAAESPGDAEATTTGTAAVEEGAETGETPVDQGTDGADAADATDAAEEAVPESDEATDDESAVTKEAVSESERVSDDESEPASTTADPDELDRLRQELDAVRAEKAELEAERDDYREEVERLRERVSSLEAEIDRLDADTDAVSASTLDPDEALSGTNLFVRYEDKVEGTLERAAEGRISPSELHDNLRLDYHTEFEEDGVHVDDRPFDAFLRDTPEYQFSLWLLTSLTYEIRRTDTRAGLSKLYEAIQQVDRLDLDGAVDVTVEDGPADGDTETTTMTFDVVFRDKMGAPLFAAAFDDTRDPTHAETIRSLLDGARSVSDAVPAFAAAFAVTTSFFDSDAMEVAVDATRGGLFSRSSRNSYVKISRKAGFHLCLVEARDEDFFLTVPEL
jgi:hypothetical protein